MTRSFLQSISDDSLISKVVKLRPLFVKAAQFELDAWEQDENGEDAELGYGGICQDIAEAFCSVCGDNGIDCMSIASDMGEQHVWAVAYNEETEECCEIDINPYTYETGSGYIWRKIQGVIITPENVMILPCLWEDFKYNLRYT